MDADLFHFDKLANTCRLLKSNGGARQCGVYTGPDMPRMDSCEGYYSKDEFTGPPASTGGAAVASLLGVMGAAIVALLA